jgi:P27 family predicted phage terminase small subunit
MWIPQMLLTANCIKQRGRHSAALFYFELQDERKQDMPSGGHNKKSNATKKAFGTYRADRDHTKKPQPVTPAPQQAPFTLRCPAWIDRESQLAWKRTVREIGHRLKNEDGPLVESFAVQYSLWKRATQQLAESGPVVTVKGTPKRNPLVQIVAEYARGMAAAAKMIGVDAGLRQRTTMSPEEALSKLSDEQLQEKLQIAREAEQEGIEDDEESTDTEQ